MTCKAACITSETYPLCTLGCGGIDYNICCDMFRPFVLFQVDASKVMLCCRKARKLSSKNRVANRLLSQRTSP